MLEAWGHEAMMVEQASWWLMEEEEEEAMAGVFGHSGHASIRPFSLPFAPKASRMTQGLMN